MRRFSSLPIPAPLTLPPLPFTHPYQFHHLPCIPLCLLSLPPHPQFHVVVILLMAGAPVGHPCSLHSFVLSSFDFLPSRSFGFDIRSTRNKGSHNPCFFLPPSFLPSSSRHTRAPSLVLFSSSLPHVILPVKNACSFVVSFFSCSFFLALLLSKHKRLRRFSSFPYPRIRISMYPRHDLGGTRANPFRIFREFSFLHFRYFFRVVFVCFLHVTFFDVLFGFSEVSFPFFVHFFLFFSFLSHHLIVFGLVWSGFLRFCVSPPFLFSPG